MYKIYKGVISLNHCKKKLYSEIIEFTPLNSKGKLSSKNELILFISRLDSDQRQCLAHGKYNEDVFLFSPLILMKFPQKKIFSVSSSEQKEDVFNPPLFKEFDIRFYTDQDDMNSNDFKAIRNLDPIQFVVNLSFEDIKHLGLYQHISANYAQHKASMKWFIDNNETIPNTYMNEIKESDILKKCYNEVIRNI